MLHCATEKLPDCQCDRLRRGICQNIPKVEIDE